MEYNLRLRLLRHIKCSPMVNLRLEVAIALDMREPDVTQLYKESWTLKQIYDLNSIYLETKGNLGSFVKLYMLSKEAGINAEHVVRILRLADDDLLRVEGKYYNLKSEVKSLEAKKGGLIRTIQEYDNQLRVLGKSFDNYCRLCQEEEVKLSILQKERLKAEALVTQFQENNREYLKIRNVVEEKVYSVLSNGVVLLKLAVSTIIHSMRNNPEQYISLIRDNFSPANYNNSPYPIHSNNYDTQDFETILVNNAAKVYDRLAKDLVDEILSKYDISTLESSLPLLSPLDSGLTSRLIQGNPPSTISG